MLGGAGGLPGSILRGQGLQRCTGRPAPTSRSSTIKHHKFDKVSAMTQMEDWITKYGGDGFDAIFSENDAMALGAIEAMNSAGIDAKAKVICGVDALYEAAWPSRSGYIDASSAQSSGRLCKCADRSHREAAERRVDSHCVDDQNLLTRFWSRRTTSTRCWPAMPSLAMTVSKHPL